MMIVAKTQLKKLPQSCGKCSLSYVDNWDYRMCRVKGRECPKELSPNGRMMYGKPGWCPLVEVNRPHGRKEEADA